MNKSLFQTGNFTLHSGKESTFKIDCDALTTDDWRALAQIIHQRYQYRRAVGVPRGGVALANALNEMECYREAPLLIVDDVVTTGAAMEEYRQRLYSAGLKDTKGVAVFAREGANVPEWITPMFTMTDRKDDPGRPVPPHGSGPDNVPRKVNRFDEPAMDIVNSLASSVLKGNRGVIVSDIQGLQSAASRKLRDTWNEAIEAAYKEATSLDYYRPTYKRIAALKVNPHG